MNMYGYEKFVVMVMWFIVIGMIGRCNEMKDFFDDMIL